MIKEVMKEGLVSPEINSYLLRMWDNIEHAILESVNVIPVREIPTRPKEGVIYYLTGDIDPVFATKGYWVWIDDGSIEGVFEKLVYGSQINELKDQVDELEDQVDKLEDQVDKLEDRVTALENP